jgi:perosamine synthetase
MNYKIKQVEPDIGKREIKYVKDALKRRWITEGRYAELFLNRIIEYTGAKYAVLAPNGTLAIYMALYALGVKRNDRVIVPDITFNATASAVHFLGAKPVFCDVNPETMQLDVEQIPPNLDEYDIQAIIPVHLYGQSVEMGALMEIARKNNILVMEDAAQGLGVFHTNIPFHTPYHNFGHHVGTFGDAGIFAFFADKNIIMGEGGVVVTNDEQIYLNLKYLRNQGRIKSGCFEHERLGMNFRITDMQCAVGYAQMERLDELINKRIAIYTWYQKHLKNELKSGSIHMMKISKHSNHVPLRCPLLVNNKKQVMEHLEKNGIQTRSLEYPLHRQPCWRHLKYKKDAFPNANTVYEKGMNLPIHNRLTEKDVKYVCDKIKEAL